MIHLNLDLWLDREDNGLTVLSKLKDNLVV